MVYGVRLKSGFRATERGFESPSLDSLLFCLKFVDHSTDEYPEGVRHLACPKRAIGFFVLMRPHHFIRSGIVI